MTSCDTVGRSNVSYLCQGLLMVSRTQQGRRLKADPGRSRCTQSSVRSLRNMKPSLRWQCDKMGWLEGNRYRMDLHGFLIRRWKPDGWVEVLAEVVYLATSGTPLVALTLNWFSLIVMCLPIQEIVCCTHPWGLIRLAFKVMDKERTGFVDREVPQGILPNWWNQLPGALGVFGFFFPWRLHRKW